MSISFPMLATGKVWFGFVSFHYATSLLCNIKPKVQTSDHRFFSTSLASQKRGNNIVTKQWLLTHKLLSYSCSKHLSWSSSCSTRKTCTLRLIAMIKDYYATSSVSKQDEPRIELSCLLGITCQVSPEKFPFKPNHKSLIDQAFSVKVAGYWPRSFFASLWPLTPSQSINRQKENSVNIQPSWPHAWSITIHMNF